MQKDKCKKFLRRRNTQNKLTLSFFVFVLTKVKKMIIIKLPIT